MAFREQVKNRLYPNPPYAQVFRQTVTSRAQRERFLHNFLFFVKYTSIYTRFCHDLSFVPLLGLFHTGFLTL